MKKSLIELYQAVSSSSVSLNIFSLKYLNMCMLNSLKTKILIRHVNRYLCVTRVNMLHTLYFWRDYLLLWAFLKRLGPWSLKKRQRVGDEDTYLLKERNRVSLITCNENNQVSFNNMKKKLDQVNETMVNYTINNKYYTQKNDTVTN